MGESNNAVFDGRRENRSYALNSKANSFWLAKTDNTDIDKCWFNLRAAVNQRARITLENELETDWADNHNRPVFRRRDSGGKQIRTFVTGANHNSPQRRPIPLRRNDL